MRHTMSHTVGVIGLDGSGLTLAMRMCEQGIRVIGVDSDGRKIAWLTRGLPDPMDAPIPYVADLLQRHVASGLFMPVTRTAVAAWEGNTYLVTVNGPVDEQRNHTFEQTFVQLGRVIKPNDLIIAYGAMVPGTMEDRVIPLLSTTSRLLPGHDFHVVYAAQRLSPEQVWTDIMNLDVVLGGVNEAAVAAAATLFGQLTKGHIHVTSMRLAQAVRIADAMPHDPSAASTAQAWFSAFYGIDMNELIHLAHKYPGVHLLEPGVGIPG